MEFEAFNFSQLAGENPFGEQKNSNVDDRFYRLPKDDSGRGSAVIRFLPDPEMKMMQQLFRINVNGQRGEERRWVSEWSPQNIGMPDPFHDEWQRLWRAGDKKEASKFSRQTRYIANILVVRDPVNPDNEGKIFLLDMSQSLKAIVQDALMPSRADQALGVKPKQLFNPLKGNNFRLSSKRGENGFITYEPSAPDSEETSVFASPEEAMETIKTKCYALSEFLKPELYKTFDELKNLLDYVTFADVSESTNKKVETEVVDPAPSSTAELNNFLDSLDAGASNA